jgi:branched-chain amino acid transport system permease protein
VLIISPIHRPAGCEGRIDVSADEGGRVSDTVHETPGALEQEFTPDVEQPHASAPTPVPDVRLGGWTRARVAWSITAVVFVAWAVWAFIDNGTLFTALLGAGLAKGAIVSLAAIGFIMIMKATGIANFAQGDLITIGGYLGLWATSKTLPAHDGLGLSLGLGYLLVIALMFVLGVVIERVAYAPLARRAHDVHVVVIATLGVAIILRTIMSLWQGTEPRFLQSWFNLGGSLDGFLFFKDGTLTVNVGFLGIDDAVISAQRVVIMVVTAVVVLAIMALFARTSFGRQVRAIAADRETARLYGVKASRMSMLSFGISAALAGLAGLMIGPLGSFDLSLGFAYMLLGFAAAVLGGFGSIGGTVLGAIMIGLTEELFGGQMLPLLVEKLGGDPADALRYRSVLPYVLMLVVIAIRPQGLFGRAGKRL